MRVYFFILQNRVSPFDMKIGARHFGVVRKLVFKKRAIAGFHLLNASKLLWTGFAGGERGAFAHFCAV